MTVTTISYTVSVDTAVSPAEYTIYDSEKKPTEAPTPVTQPNTVITYTLEENSNSLRFIAPEITGDPNHDLQCAISSDGQTLTIIDSDADQETICLKLVTVPKDQVFVSQDPQILNRPET